MPCIVFLSPPPNFFPKVEVSGCFCEWENKFLLLKRHTNRPQGDTWGLPAGKLESGESARSAVIREVREETGLNINDQHLKEVCKFYIRLSNLDYIFHLFQFPFNSQPKLFLNQEEHVEAQWMTFEQALTLDLIQGGEEIIDHYRKR